MIGILGGAFDPVHYGHLELARMAGESIGLDGVIFVPLGAPPHRSQPQVSAELRVMMLRAAIAPYDHFDINTQEVDKDSTSWTVVTLENLADKMPDETLCLLLGSDAFKPLNSWYRWRSITDYCHIAVISRQNDRTLMDKEVATFLHERRTDVLQEKPAGEPGKVMWLEVDVPDISSTEIRQQISQGGPLGDLLPASVEALIKENGLYGYE